MPFQLNATLFEKDESGDNIFAFSTPTDVEYDPNKAKEKKEYITMLDA
jgi:L-aminopeptidase/D-esterase-like protein